MVSSSLVKHLAGSLWGLIVRKEGFGKWSRPSADLLGMGFQFTVALDPAGPGLMAVAPKRFEHTFGSFDLLQGGREGLSSLRQVGDCCPQKTG